MTTDERIENLEKGLASARRLNRWLLAAVGLALGVWILAGTFGPTMAGAPAGGGAVKEIRANRFVVEDENGKGRAMLEVNEEGTGLGLADENGKLRAGLFMTKDGSGLSLRDENRKTRVMLNVTKDGPMLALADENGKSRARLDVVKEGAGLRLIDEKGQGRVTVGVTQITSPDGRTITYPESSLLLYGADGKVIWQAR